MHYWSTFIVPAPGMVPRALKHLFDGIEDRKRTATEQGIPPPQFDITVQFLELYNEEIKDLFNAARESSVCSLYMNTLLVHTCTLLYGTGHYLKRGKGY